MTPDQTLTPDRIIQGLGLGLGLGLETLTLTPDRIIFYQG